MKSIRARLFGGSGISSRTVELAKKIRKDYHVEPLVHLTCLNYTKREICEILDELKEAGLENILALRGPEPRCRTKTGFPVCKRSGNIYP